MFSGSKELTCITSIIPMKMNEKWLCWISRNILCVAKVPPGGESRYYSEFTAGDGCKLVGGQKNKTAVTWKLFQV